MVPAEPGLPPSLPISSTHSRPLHTHHSLPRGASVDELGVWPLAPGRHAQQASHARQVLNAQSLTDTASRCPVKVYRCWQLWASQIRMSLLRSPEACGYEGNGHQHTPHPKPPPAHRADPVLRGTCHQRRWPCRGRGCCGLQAGPEHPSWLEGSHAASAQSLHSLPPRQERSHWDAGRASRLLSNLPSPSMKGQHRQGDKEGSCAWVQQL